MYEEIKKYLWDSGYSKNVCYDISQVLEIFEATAIKISLAKEIRGDYRNQILFFRITLTNGRRAVIIKICGDMVYNINIESYFKAPIYSRFYDEVTQ